LIDYYHIWKVKEDRLEEVEEQKSFALAEEREIKEDMKVWVLTLTLTLTLKIDPSNQTLKDRDKEAKIREKEEKQIKELIHEKKNHLKESLTLTLTLTLTSRSSLI